MNHILLQYLVGRTFQSFVFNDTQKTYKMNGVYQTVLHKVVF